MKTVTNQKTARTNPLFRPLSLLLAVLLLVGALLSSTPVQMANAATTCTTLSDGDWADAAIWDCPGGPSSADSVFIRHLVTLNTDKTAAYLSIAVDEGSNSYAGLLQFLGAHTLTLSGNLNVDQGGIIDPGTGTIAFADGNQTITTHDQWVDFYNFSKESTGSLSFAPSASGGVHVLNTLTLKSPVSTTNLPLRSTVSGAQWRVWYEMASDVDYVDVKDSAVVDGSIDLANGLNAGNNTGWNFAGAAATSVVLTPSENPAILSRPVVLSVTIVPSNATGTVSFEDSSGYIAGCYSIPVVNGTASCTVQLSAKGTKEIRAEFDADPPWGYLESNSIQLVTVFGKFYLPFSSR